MLTADEAKPPAVMGPPKGADGRAVGAGLRSYYKVLMVTEVCLELVAFIMHLFVIQSLRHK